MARVSAHKVLSEAYVGVPSPFSHLRPIHTPQGNIPESKGEDQKELERLRKMIEQASAADARGGRPLLSRRAARIKGAKSMRASELVPLLRELLESAVGTWRNYLGWLGR